MTVARAVGGIYAGQGVSERHPVDGVVRLDEFVVVGNPEFATLITGEAEALMGRLIADQEAASLLAQAVFVSSRDDPELHELLAHHGLTGILGAQQAGEALHARLLTIIAEDQAADDRLVTTGTKVLTQVARRGGATAVLNELAHRIDGWAVLIDGYGQPIASAGAGRLHINDAAAVALGRPVKVRHQGLQTHQVGSDRELVGYLVISSRSSVTSRNRDLASQAASLFDLLLRTHDPSLTDRLGRNALLDTLLAGGSRASRLLQQWGVREPSLTAFAVGSRSRTVDLEQLVARWLDELGTEHIFATDTGRVSGFVPDESVPGLVEQVALFAPVGTELVHLGIGRAAPIEALAPSATQASQALDTAMEAGRITQRFADLPAVDLVLDGLAPDNLARLAGVLDALRDESGDHGDLAETLHVFLSEHGGHRSSAARLGIHRQTLGARIRRIEALTRLSMSLADDRAAAWLALRELGF